MGCTSSAQNMASPHSTSDKSLNTSEEYFGYGRIEEINAKPTETTDDVAAVVDKEIDTNAINVLPPCDKLEENTQLARNNKSFVEMTKLESEGVPDAHENEHVIESENKDVTINTENENVEEIPQAEKISRMEEVVEKVVEMFVGDNVTENSQTEQDKHEAGLAKTEKPRDDDQSAEKQVNETVENEIEDQEEVASPSQSQSSRATRWEALADMAAELPPSLTVDPITGQIYALK